MNKEQMVEQRAKALYSLGAWNEIASHGCPWDTENAFTRDGYRRIARAEIERESRLVDCLVSYDYRFRERAIKEWESEFEPPKRTLEQVAADIEHCRIRSDDWPSPHGSAERVPKSLLDELAALLPKGGA